MADADLQTIVQRMIDGGESEDNIATVIQHFTAPPAPATPSGDTSSSLLLAAAGQGVPVTAKAAAALSASPNAAKIGGALARGGTTLAGVIHGAATRNIPEIVSAPIAGWQAGKGGYWLTKGLQRVAAPVGKALEKVAPYAQTLSTLSGAQGLNDLAQMAEPGRRDIGFLGFGPSQPTDRLSPEAERQIAYRIRQRIAAGEPPSQELATHDPAPPAALNRLATQIREIWTGGWARGPK